MIASTHRTTLTKLIFIFTLILIYILSVTLFVSIVYYFLMLPFNCYMFIGALWP